MEDEGQALRLVDLTYRFARALAEETRQHVDEVADLEIGEFVLLRAIASGQATPTELSREMHAHPAATSRTLTQLVKSGLVERRPDQGDSRRLTVALTDHGREVVAAIAARIRPRLQRRLDQLPGGEASRLIGTLEQLLATETGS